MKRLFICVLCVLSMNAVAQEEELTDEDYVEILDSLISGEFLKDMSKPLPQRTFNVNPLGVLQLGPIVQGEFRMGESNGYLVPHIRIPYLGLLYHVIAVDDWSDGGTASPVALGLGVGYKTLFPLPRGAWYWGGAMDYSFGSSESEEGGWESHFQNLAIMGNGGFRWRPINKKSVLSIGAYVGLIVPLQDETQNIGGGTEDERQLLPIAMLELSFGWEKLSFGRKK